MMEQDFLLPDALSFKYAVPNLDEYYELFKTTGWNDKYKFTAEELQKAVKSNWFSVSVYSNDWLIGYGGVLSDGIYHALIVDLIVHPKYQSRGIGSKMLERLIEKCKDSQIRDIQLFSSIGNSEFYRKFGFEKRQASAPGMQLKY